MILGLDVSTRCTGWAVFDDDGLVDFGAIKTPTNKKSTLYTKITKVVEQLINISDKYQIDEIYIEEILNKFSGGKSSAKTIVSLARYNGIVSYKCWEVFAIEPKHIPAVTARKTIGIKVPRSEDTKKFILDTIVNTWNVVDVEFTRHGNVAQHCFDIADAIVIAHAGYVKENSTKKNIRVVH